MLTDQNHSYEDPDAPIGRNVVVAAGSVVRGEVPDHCVVAGVPARVIREHTSASWQSPRARTEG